MARTKEATKNDVHMTSWLHAEEVPRAGLPDAAKLNKRRKNFRIGVWTVLILTPFTGLLTVAALNSVANTPKPVVPPAVLSSPGRAAATVALDNWLNAKPAPIVGGRTLLWSGVTSLPNPVSTTTAVAAPGGNDAPSPTQIGTEIDRFVVVGADGATYEASLQVSLDNVGAASVIAGPALTPIPAMSADELGSASESPWPGLTVGSAADPVNTAVQGWATAFTGGDPAALRQVVGDPDNGHSYLPLSGVGAVTIAIGSAAIPAGGAAADHLLVRATITPAPVAPVGGDSAVTPVGFTYDLLVEHASTAAPVVIAWGAPGSGPTLTPYVNALSAASDQPTIGMLHPTGLAASTAAGSAPLTTATVTTTVPPVTGTAAATGLTGLTAPTTSMTPTTPMTRATATTAAQSAETAPARTSPASPGTTAPTKP